jgi:hypothetical protein
MTPGDFLRALWPAEGIYCFATPFVIPKSSPPQTVFAHKTFNDISDAVSFVLAERGNKDLYFAIHTLKEHTVFNPHKVNRKTGEMGANEVRTHPNMKESRAFFFDLDVGKEANKYQSQGEAVAGLQRFCIETGLPKPLIIDSGYGIHVYWIIVNPLASTAWQDHAMKLKQLALHYGLKIDTSRTTDTSSILRVVGSFNFKNRSAPKEVKAKSPLDPIGTGVFTSMLDKAIIAAGITAVEVPKLEIAANDFGSNIEINHGPPVSIKALLKGCGQMARIAIAEGNVPEPQWYNGVIGVGRFLEDGHRRVHQMSQGFPGYSESETNEKIRQHTSWRDARTGKGLGPTSCKKLLEVSPGHEEICAKCPFAGKVHGPLGAAKFHDPAPAPVIQQLLSGPVDPPPITLPDPPPPFIRLRGGGIAMRTKNADGDEENIILYEHDLFPIRRVVNVQQQTEQLVWHVELPRGEAKDFTLDADMLYDSRKFTTAISNHGVYPHKGNINGLQEYMVHYIQQLQRLVDADTQCNHLGWTEEFDGFILPDRVLGLGGTVKATQLSLHAARASATVSKKGDAQKQADLLKFYEHPDYKAHQFFILCSFASPLFHATGHHGVIVNASGESGAGKTTCLYAAASAWGQPELYPINGTNNGATIRGRNERVTVLANLPICVDEITHMLPRDAVDLAMSITQPAHRIRLDNSGQERAHIGSYKSTIMLTTANNSLHGILSQDNSQGTAGSMRVFEIRFPIPKVHKKRDADDFKFNLTQNYGHLGEMFVVYLLKTMDICNDLVRAEMARVDQDLGIQASERNWGAVIAAVMVTGHICNSIGILTYDMDALREWIYTVQVPQMRGIVKEEYRPPIGILNDFFEHISQNMIVMGRVTGNDRVHAVRRPEADRGAVRTLRSSGADALCIEDRVQGLLHEDRCQLPEDPRRPEFNGRRTAYRSHRPHPPHARRGYRIRQGPKLRLCSEHGA